MRTFWRLRGVVCAVTNLVTKQNAKNGLVEPLRGLRPLDYQLHPFT